ncbi:cell envelope-related transcriptional attenuator [Actinobacteria bacterium OK074]|nr:cell envelope-related transcriptional attenuator [Actinobacteria bacterium OK074]
MSDPWGGGSMRQATRQRSGGQRAGGQRSGGQRSGTPPHPRESTEDDGVPDYSSGSADGSAYPLPGGRAAARQAARGRGSRKAGRPQGRRGAEPPPGRGGRAASRRAKPVKRKRLARIALFTVSVLVLVTAAAGGWLYYQLNGNIKSVAIGDGGSEKANASGDTPINILVIGSDGRNSAEDCKLGGGCGTASSTAGHNADVEMVVHISADRSNATVMSVPRDTMTQVPACKDPDTGQSTAGYYGQINSALQYGAACQVSTVHQLTGIPIDHFVELDFAGVVSMSDAVGGVSVCVDNDVYDTYSHLKLSKGTHTLKGTAALEFVRSRHGFGDGSDLGRTVSQHLFLSAMIRKFKSAGTLANPAKVLALANAATKALTVDTGLDSIPKLVGLVADVNEVPAKRMTFTTMQTAPAPGNSNRVVPASAAKTLFATITNDQSLTSGKKKTSKASPTPTVSVSPADIAVDVENGTATSGRASVVADALINAGFGSGTTTGNAPEEATTTTLTYGPGEKAQAQAVASALGLPVSRLSQGTASGLVLVIGSDWTDGTTYGGGSSGASSAAPSDTGAATTDAHAQTAADAKGCAQVSTYKTVSLNGVAMTPSQAYAAASSKKDSAP